MFKKTIALLLILVSIIGMSACSCVKETGSAPTTSKKDSVSSAKKPEAVSEKTDTATQSLAGTYWDLHLGYTLGTNYFAYFDSDSSFTAYSQAGNHYEFKGNYVFREESIFITFENLKNEEFQKTDMGYRSVNKHKIQEGEDYFTLKPTDGTAYKNCVASAKEENKLKPVRSAFSDLYKTKKKEKTTAYIKPGKYKRSEFPSDYNPYTYITLRKDGTYLFETNTKQNRSEAISPVSFEGDYVVYTGTIIYPDNSSDICTYLKLYFEDYDVYTYVAEKDSFGTPAYRFELAD